MQAVGHGPVWDLPEYNVGYLSIDHIQTSVHVLYITQYPKLLHLHLDDNHQTSD